MTMKIMLWTNSPHCNSGYGGQARALIPRLRSLGHEVAVAANSGLHDTSINWRGTTIYPLRNMDLGVDVISFYIREFEPDLVISLYDVWSLPTNMRQLLCGTPWLSWTPIDGDPVSEGMRNILHQADWVVGISKWGTEQLVKAGFEDARYVPLSIDTGVFCAGDPVQARENIGLPAKPWVVSVVGANKGIPPRKGWPEMLAGFGLFHEKHLDAVLYLHTTNKPYGAHGAGIYFDHLIRRLQLVEGSVFIVSEGDLAIGVPDENIADIYRMSNALMLVSRGEGFGLPILEAQACGTQVVTQRCSAMTEITWNGVLVEPVMREYHASLDYFWRITTPERICEGLEKAFKPARDKTTYGVNEAAAFDHDVVFTEYWEPLLAEVEERTW